MLLWQLHATCHAEVDAKMIGDELLLPAAGCSSCVSCKCELEEHLSDEVWRAAISTKERRQYRAYQHAMARRRSMLIIILTSWRVVERAGAPDTFLSQLG